MDVCALGRVGFDIFHLVFVTSPRVLSVLPCFVHYLDDCRGERIEPGNIGDCIGAKRR